jgi:hypothetical protein
MMDRGRLLFSEPELRAGRHRRVDPLGQMIADELAAMTRPPGDDFEVRVFAGAFMGAAS